METAEEEVLGTHLENYRGVLSDLDHMKSTVTTHQAQCVPIKESTMAHLLKQALWRTHENKPGCVLKKHLGLMKASTRATWEYTLSAHAIIIVQCGANEFSPQIPDVF
jgi:hypothetical protein